MNKIAKFEKVSFSQFRKDWLKAFESQYKNLGIDELFTEEYIRLCYDTIKLPKRSTVGSAGFDFHLPSRIRLGVNESITIPTGIRCLMEEGWVLTLFPRSGHGFKYGVHLANSVGIVDSDFYNSDNEGHIHVKLVNDSVLAQDINLEPNVAFCQGIFVPFGITYDDDVGGTRNGGWGSTDKK